MMGLILPAYLQRRRQIEEDSRHAGPWRVVMSYGDSLAAFEIKDNVKQLKWCTSAEDAWDFINKKVHEDCFKDYNLYFRDDTMVVLEYKGFSSGLVIIGKKRFKFYAVFSLRQSNAMHFVHPDE